MKNHSMPKSWRWSEETRPDNLSKFMNNFNQHRTIILEKICSRLIWSYQIEKLFRNIFQFHNLLHPFILSSKNISLSLWRKAKVITMEPSAFRLLHTAIILLILLIKKGPELSRIYPIIQSRKLLLYLQCWKKQ